MMSDDGNGQRVDGRRLRYQNRRGEILDAVMAHVLEHGISGMSFRTLAAAVGVSHVTLRHHFGTKDQLLVEIFGAIGTQLPIPDHFGADDGADDVEALVRTLWRRWTEPEGDRRSWTVVIPAVKTAALERRDCSSPSHCHRWQRGGTGTRQRHAGGRIVRAGHAGTAITRQ